MTLQNYPPRNHFHLHFYFEMIRRHSTIVCVPFVDNITTGCHFLSFSLPSLPSPLLFFFFFFLFSFSFFWIIISSLLFERQSTLLLTTELHVPCLHQKGMRGCTLLTTTTTMMTMITITADWQTVHQQTETDSVLVNY